MTRLQTVPTAQKEAAGQPATVPHSLPFPRLYRAHIAAER